MRVLVAFLLIGLVANAHAASVSLVQTTTIDLDQVQIDEVVTFDIVIDFSDGPTLGGGFDIVYDVSALLLVGFSRDTNVGDLDFSRDPDVSPGLLESWAIGDFNGVPDTATLGNVTFQVLSGIGPNTVVTASATSGIGGPWVSNIDFVSLITPTYSEVLVSYDTDDDGEPNASDSDDDGDGMSDDFELANGLAPLDPTDADADADGDGSTNLEEFRAGTDPRNAAEFPAVRKVPVSIFILLLEDEEE